MAPTPTFKSKDCPERLRTNNFRNTKKTRENGVLDSKEVGSMREYDYSVS